MHGSQLNSKAKRKLRKLFDDKCDRELSKMNNMRINININIIILKEAEHTNEVYKNQKKPKTATKD